MPSPNDPSNASIQAALSPPERDALAMSAGGLPGMGLDPDHADMLNPGPAWRAETAKRQGEARKLQAVTTLQELLGALTPEDRAAIAREVLSG